VLPIVDKPTILYTVEEAVQSGFGDIIIISGKNKMAIEDYFNKSYKVRRTYIKKVNLGC
jgi:UTP--glucose-1-phosphate uridylyltransferase